MAEITKTNGFCYVAKAIITAVVGSVLARLIPSVYKASAHK